MDLQIKAIVIDNQYVVKDNKILCKNSVTGIINWYDMTPELRNKFRILIPARIVQTVSRDLDNIHDSQSLPIEPVVNTEDIDDIFFQKCLSDLLVEPDDDIILLAQHKYRQDNVFMAHMALQSNNNITKIDRYMEHVVASYSAQQFQENFRLTREAFQYTLSEIRLVLPATVGPGKSQISLEKQLLAVIWLLATPESYRSVSERFAMSKSTLSASFVRIVNAINKLSGRIIAWPTGSRRLYVKRKFEEQNSAFRGCMGLIDGTYVKIKAPKEQVRSYTNRKCFTSMTLQCICDPEKKFIDVYTGWPSSVPDIRIFKNSRIYTDCHRDVGTYFEEGEFILGDKGYQGGADWCVVPFTAREARTADHIKFNEMHSKIRVKIENSFALLFGRFRRLKDLDMNRLDWMPATILACCVLHNICLDHNDPMAAEYSQEGLRYLQNFNEGPESNYNAEGVGSTRNESANIRERIFSEYRQQISSRSIPKN